MECFVRQFIRLMERWKRYTSVRYARVDLSKQHYPMMQSFKLSQVSTVQCDSRHGDRTPLDACRTLILITLCFCIVLASGGDRQLAHGQVDQKPKAPGSDKLDLKKLDFFESKIRPVLIKQCFGCHSADADEIGGNLLLDSKQGMVVGGDLGPSLIPGNPEKSLILSALRHDELEMPPDGKLSDTIIADFEQWIKDGAVDPRIQGTLLEKQKIDLEQGRKFWCFQPLKRTSELESGKSIQSNIDKLVLSHLAKKGQRFNPPTAASELLERVYFDLTGLPPAVEVQKKYADGQISYEQIVNELLQSRHYGERFGRHWLDVARYADSSGGGRVLLFPEAWRYRDYVINSFNTDKPFSEFIQEQIAGDLLQSQTLPTRSEQLTALGFLMLGPHNYELQDKELLRMEVVDEQINVVGRAFLGLTLSCARCHDHKFDPIPTADYYALAGIFRSTKSLLPGNVSQFVTSELPLPPERRKQFEKFSQARKQLQSEIDQLTTQLSALRKGRANFVASDLDSFSGVVLDESQAKRHGTWIQSTSVKPFIYRGYHHSPEADAKMAFELKVKQGGKYTLRVAYTASSNRTDKAEYVVTAPQINQSFVVNQRRAPPSDGHFIKLTDLELSAGDQVTVVLKTGPNGTTIADAVHLSPVRPSTISKAEVRETQAQLKQLEQQLSARKKELTQLNQSSPKSPAKVMSVREEQTVEDYFVCIRGDVHSLGPKVPRGALQVIGDLQAFDGLAGSGRLELARWMTHADQPLTARVYANRIWSWIFGQGIVATPDNFGVMGARPVHPELLDYLASELIANDWSTKKLVKAIVLSQAYRQSVSTQASADAEFSYLGRQARRRLDAESLRDRILYFSGQLDLKSGGPAIKPGTRSEFGYRYDSPRRSIYLPVFRNTLNDLFDVFDFPNPNLVSGKRHTSVLPTQALYLMNSKFIADQSKHAAQRILDFAPHDFAQQLDYAYQMGLSRKPTKRERQIATRFFATVSKNQPANESRESAASTRSWESELAWQQYCQILMASIDFRYLD